MATATMHHLSIITNNCVKTPVNPKNGLVATVNEREPADISDTWRGKDVNCDDPGEEWSQRFSQDISRPDDFQTENMTLLDTPDLAELSDEEFYKRLRQLKDEHKKTLELCEKVYTEKLAERTDNAEADGLRKSVDTFRHDSDHIKDMSCGKPPTGRLRTSIGFPSKSLSNINRHSSDAYWRAPSVSTTDRELSDDELTGRKERKLISNDDTQSMASSRIEDMWENFSIDDYAPRTRGHSNSQANMTASSEKRSKGVTESNEWQHRITIPQPFQMTMREVNKPKTKTRAMVEVDELQREKERQEEIECQKKFKARPVPAHIYMPLYDEIIEEQETKRRYNRVKSQELTKSIQKPFKFAEREQMKKKHRRSFHGPFSSIDNKEKKHFKANPFPEHIFSDDVNDKAKEEEEYRRIRKQMRSEDLLKSATLPPTMSARGKDYTDGKSRRRSHADKARKAGIITSHKFQPKINHDIPDFEEIHKDLMKKMSDAKQKEATVCKPFNLKTAYIPTKKHKVYEDIQSDEQMLRENRWPFKNSKSQPLSKSFGSWASSLDTIPTKTTTSADLRTSANKSRMEKRIAQELLELEEDRKRRLKEKQLKKQIARKASANDQTLNMHLSTKEKLKRYRESERDRQEEYRRTLNEINERVENRPHLFERASQVNAKLVAERKYRDTLRASGVDEDFVSRKSSGAASLADMEDDDSDHYLKREHYSHDSAPESDQGSYSYQNSFSKSQNKSLTGSRRYSSDQEYSEDSQHTDNESSLIEEDIA